MWKIGIAYSCLALTVAVSLAKEEVPPNIVAGKQVEADARLTVGTKLVGIWDKKNYLVDVLEIKSDKTIRIHWIGFDKSEDADVPPNSLYYPADTSQTRKSRTSLLPREYQTFDKNGDGQIGLYEWERAKYAEFKKLDKNHDGFLTPQELAGKGAVVVATATTPTATTTTPTTPTTPTPDPTTTPAALPNPGNLQGYSALFSQSFTFNVTGKVEGSVVGTEVFSTSSDLAAAAVHAGLVKVGEMRNVTATIVNSPQMYKGSAANGVTSVDGPASPAAFTLK